MRGTILVALENILPSEHTIAQRVEARKILVVEDNRHIRLAMTTFLKMKGFDVLEADTLESARAGLKNGPVSVVITDLNLPDGKGDELLEMATSPIIAMTGQVDEATRQRIQAQGFSAFLPKPASLDQVLEAVEQALSSRA